MDLLKLIRERQSAEELQRKKVGLLGTYPTASRATFAPAEEQPFSLPADEFRFAL